MADFQFVAFDVDASSSTTKDFSSENIHFIIQEFQYFLKGAGYDFEGNIELVPSDNLDFEITNFEYTGGGNDLHYGYPEDNIEITYGDTNG